MTILGMGCIPDRLAESERDGRNRHIAGLVGSNPMFPAEVDYSDRLDFVPDQQNTNRCVAWSVSSAVYLAGQVSGRPIPRPSAKWNYDVARYVDTPGVLVDVGSRCWSMMQGLNRHGMISEATLPTTEQNVNEPPPFDVDVSAASATLTGYYKLEGNVPTLMRMALAAGHLPVFAMMVHESFQDLGRDVVYDEPEGMELGRHMVCVVGARPGAIKIVNSWSTNWCDSGFAWISDRFLASHYVADKYCVTAAPTGLA